MVTPLDALHALLGFAGVEPGDRVLIVPGPATDPVVLSQLEGRLDDAGAATSRVDAPAFDPRTQDPPAPFLSALLEADVVLDFADHEALVHRPAVAQAVRHGALRLVVVSLQSVDDWRSAFAAYPLPELLARVRVLAARLAGGGSSRLTTAAGTDLAFTAPAGFAIGWPGGSEPGLMRRGRGAFGLYPPGAIGTRPEHAAGRLVLDGLVGFPAPLAEPIELEVADGRARVVRGGREADWLRERMAGHENGGHVAKLIVGAHPAAPLGPALAELEWRKARLSRAEGAVLVGFGDARAIGGSVASSWHWDGLALPPCRWDVAGRPLFRDGAAQAAPEVRSARLEPGAAPHRPRLLARAGSLGAFLVESRGAMPYFHRNPDSDEIWIPLGDAPLQVVGEDAAHALAPGEAAVVPRNVAHRAVGGDVSTPLLVLERLSPAATDSEGGVRLLDIAALGRAPTPAWTQPPRPLWSSSALCLEGYSRPEGMLREPSRLEAPELWIVLRGRIALAWDGAFPVAEAGAGDLLTLPAGGDARVVSIRPDTLTLRVMAR